MLKLMAILRFKNVCLSKHMVNYPACKELTLSRLMESSVQLRDNNVLIAHGRLSGIIDKNKSNIMYFCH